MEGKICQIIESTPSPWISVEFFPPKTATGIRNLFEACEHLKPYDPKFVDVTWGAGGSSSDLTVDLCVRAKNEHGMIPNMHLTCTNMEMKTIDLALERCHTEGIRNIVALRGDAPAGQDKWTAKDNDLTCALDLVKHIRKLYGDFFSIGVAGYPEGHPTKMTLIEGGLESLSASELGRYSMDTDESGTEHILVCKDADFESELDYLKEKVDAGANFIITQMFFDVEVFGSFVVACRAKGITVPILPGVMCLSNYGGFRRMAKLCKTRIPQDLNDAMEEAKADEAAVKAVGVSFGIKICRRLLELGAPGLHFYTLNTSGPTIKILEGLGISKKIVAVEPESVFRIEQVATTEA